MIKILNVLFVALLALGGSVWVRADNHFYLGSSLGASTAKIKDANAKIIYADHQLTDAYPVKNIFSTTALISLNGGYEWAGQGWKPAIALGLGVYSTPAHYNYQGQLIETAADDPSTTLYDYQYELTSSRLMAEGQISWNLNSFLPFFTVGIGPSWNKLSGYSETPIGDLGFTALPPFQSKTETHLAYQVGFGLGYAFNFSTTAAKEKHERLAAGYRYVNAGNMSFGTRGVDYPYSLNLGRLTSQEIYLAYVHLF